MKVRGWAGLAVVIAAAAPVLGGDLKIDNVGITLIEQSDVPAREGGVIGELLVREGDRVAAGDILAQVDDRAARLDLVRYQIELENARQLASSETKIEIAKKTLELAELEWRRAQDAVKRRKGAVTESHMDRLRIDVAKARLELKQAEEELATNQLALKAAENEVVIAEHKVEMHRVRAPIGGVVVEVKRQRGESVKPGDPVIRILSTSRLRAEGFVRSDDLKEKLEDRAVQVTAAIPGHGDMHFDGKVVFVSPEINAVNGQVRFWAEVENRDGWLRPGMVARMTVFRAGGDSNPESAKTAP